MVVWICIATSYILCNGERRAVIQSLCWSHLLAAALTVGQMCLKSRRECCEASDMITQPVLTLLLRSLLISGRKDERCLVLGTCTPRQCWHNPIVHTISASGSWPPDSRSTEVGSQGQLLDKHLICKQMLISPHAGYRGLRQPREQSTLEEI